ncbi:MAG: MFS transporter, partial [Gammaproteobacteria bacterium]|nr:MFS transporter [Gammaproteobacteria bacterium]
MKTWLSALSAYKNPRIVAMLFLGFSAGLPILLIFSTLSLWLREAGVERSAVTYFSWAALGYSFKFVWAPLVDKLPLPFLHAMLGKRRSWMLIAQLMVIAAMVWMAMNDPASANGLTLMALAAVLLGFSSATQDIVIDAWRIEAVHSDLQSLMSANYVAGYRIGMIVAGAGALYMAEWLGSTREVYVYGAWQLTYMAMAATMFIGVVTTLLIPEPERTQESSYLHTARDYARFLMLFVVLVFTLIISYLALSDISAAIKLWIAETSANGRLAAFAAEMFRLLMALSAAIAVGWLLVKTQVADKRMLQDTYIE